MLMTLSLIADNDRYEQSLRAFTKLVRQSGILQETKERAHYLTRTQRRREKDKRASERRMRMEKKADKYRRSRNE